MDTMELKLERQTFCTGQTVLNTSVEQSVEKDFVLPDYCADIFRILKCVVDARVLSQSINGSKLTFELGVSARVLYCSEGDSRVSCIVQKMNYTKSVDIEGSCTDPAVSITPRCDYVNCRVISPRRLDIRGAVTSTVRVIGKTTNSIITNASGCNIQLRKQLVTFPAKRLSADKRVTVIEELELAQDKPPVSQIIRSDCFIEPAEQKMIAGKLVTKGDANITMVYTCVDKQGDNSIETMRFTIPFSQIIDIDGIDDSFEANVRLIPSSCEIMPTSDSQTSLECELVMLVSCEAVKYETADAVTDAYSTSCECTVKAAESTFDCTPVSKQETLMVNSKVSYADDELMQIYDSYAQADNISVRLSDDETEFTVSGNVHFSVLAKSSANTPVFLETQEPFEYKVSVPEQFAGLGRMTCDTDVRVKSCGYRMSGGDGAELTAELAVNTDITASAAKQLLCDITADTDKPKHRDDGCAVKLCYCSEQDDIWEIAKKYSTSVSAIMEENELTGDSALTRTMLLIPLTN